MDGKRWNGLLFFVKDTKKYAIRKTFFPASDWFVPHTPHGLLPSPEKYFSRLSLIE
jgi:hypothetical protein